MTVLVTGGAKRIGRAICYALADAGHDVVIHYGTSEAEAEAAANDVRDKGVEAWTVRADLLNTEEAEGLVGHATKASGRTIDHLVNNASAFPKQPWKTATYADIDHMMRIHAWAPFATTRALADQGGQAAVNLLDTRIVADDPDHGPYLLSKQALWHLTQDMARTLAPMRVNGVAPGPILTPSDGSGDATFQAAVDATVLGRMGRPEEIAHAVRFLLEAEYVTGDVVFVDGGGIYVTDKIHIRALRLRTYIGVAAWEQKARQDIVIDITIHHDQSKAGASDDVADTVDYRGIRDELVHYADESNHALLESFAQTVADKVLARDGVQAVDVRVAKPGALRFADSVAVEIHR